MRINRQPPVHLTYCFNVFPGESFARQCEAVKGWNAPVTPAGIGLRLGHQAVIEACGPLATSFTAWCREHQRYVFTINGFPYGAFHEEPVKAGVYRPDWTTVERCQYTMRLVGALAQWLPPDTPGSISSVPLWYAPDHAVDEAAAMRVAVGNLLDVARYAERVFENTGCDICIALEPEPWCRLESSADVIAFFHDELWPAVSPGERDMVRRRIGVCIDTCHCALAFEDPSVVLSAIRDAGIRIAKVQLSAAMSVVRPDEPKRRYLSRFSEPVYFHQTSGRHEHGVDRWPDLSHALASAQRRHDEWRIHYHVPLCWPGDEWIRSTRDGMTPSFWRLLASGICPNVEVETYTFDVLPPELRGGDRYDMMNRELDWVIRQWNSTHSG